MNMLTISTETLAISNSFLSIQIIFVSYLFHTKIPAVLNLQTTIGSNTFLGNQDSSILRDAAEEIIRILKDGDLRDPTRQDKISRLLTGKGTSGSSSGGMTQEKYAEFVRLGKRLDDYDDIMNQNGKGGEGDTKNRNGKKNASEE